MVECRLKRGILLWLLVKVPLALRQVLLDCPQRHQPLKHPEAVDEVSVDHCNSSLIASSSHLFHCSPRMIKSLGSWHGDAKLKTNEQQLSEPCTKF